MDREVVVATVLGLVEEDETPLWAVKSVAESVATVVPRELGREILQELAVRGDVEFRRRVSDYEPSTRVSLEVGLAALAAEDQWEVRQDALLVCATEAGRRRYLTEFHGLFPGQK